MTEQERETLARQTLLQLEEDHARRVARISTVTREEEVRKASDAERERARLVLETRQRFYEERGYVSYTNSRGEIEWLLPDEAARRIRRRERHNRHLAQTSEARRRWILLGVTLVCFALGAVGLLVLTR
ncbi:hypothetical protein L6R49_26050 [Myxococcota bacterium]|nr:hypothetical protein [Myxococcota bacterium]